MKLQNKDMAKSLSLRSAQAISNKKLESIVLLELDATTALADYFIIATASSTPQMRAALDVVAKLLKDDGIYPYSQNETMQDSLWGLIDYGFLVVHIFTEEGREYYDLDGVWKNSFKIDF